MQNSPASTACSPAGITQPAQVTPRVNPWTTSVIALVVALSAVLGAAAFNVLQRPPTVEIVVAGPEYIGPSTPIGITAKPTSSQVLSAAMWGIDVSALQTKNESDEALGTTPIEAIDTDLAAADQVENVSQNLYICNTHATANMCAGGDTWAGACGAGDVTCLTGASTDGVLIKAGVCRALRFLGTERPCVVSDTASTTYQVERVTYAGANH